MDWPVALVDELAARRCIIFLGAGASAGCISSDGSRRPPTWSAFLNELKATLLTTFNPNTINELIAKDKYLDAAEIILNNITPADFARIIRAQFVQPRYTPSAIHKAVLEIDPKVVVTTNYDEIYDQYCKSGLAVNGYNICKYYDQHLVNDLRSPVRLIVKAHGCVSDPSQIVLARSKYFEERQKFGAFYNVLDALFITNTILFIGYSLSDPDIQLVLENSNIAAPSSHKHYALMPDNMPLDIENAFSKSYNLHILKHEANNFHIVESHMQDLATAVIQSRVSNPV